MSQTVFDQIVEVMRDLFDEYEGPISRETSASDIPQWDSLAHVQLIVMVEQEAGVRFSTAEIESFRSLGDLVDTVERKKAG